MSSAGSTGVVRRTGGARRARARARRGRRLAVAAVLAVAGVALVVAGTLVERAGAVDVADGGPPDLVAATPVLSARRTPELVARPVAARAARAAVQPVIDRAAADTCVVVGDGPSQVVAHRDADPLGPASTLKLLTGAATLDLLGGDARLTTRFAAAGAPVDGVVTGDLFMVGGGDPLLSTDAYAARSTNGARPATDLEAVADQLVAAGVRRVTGGVVGDGSRYDAQRALPTWPTRFQAQNVVGPLSALVVNDGWLVDPITPDVGPGGPAPDPALHAAEVMTALLRARGVQVDGAPRSGVAPAGTTTVLEVPSLTVDEIVGELTAFSDNTTAELLVKELDVAAGGAGTTAGGLAQITSWAQQEGLPTGGMVLVDGSGLSEGNRVTCDLLAALLAADGTAGPLSDGLARPGGPGTLEDRMTSGPLRERVRAKTGTLNSVSSLAGWLRTDPGRDVSFVVVSNPQGRTASAADQRVQEDLLAALLPYPQSPPAEQLAPRPPVAPA